MFSHINTFFRIQLRRHLGNPILWVIALAAPIAARYMVPSQNDGYTVLSINGAYPVLTPGVIGLELGIIAALLLTPLVYIFLRVSRVKNTPWQIEDVTPALRSKQMFGHWLADTAVLWVLLVGLAISGVILSAFRLPLSDIRPLETASALLIIACPAFAVIAALRLFFSSRPLLRGPLGDVVFFVFWMAGIVAGGLIIESDGSSIADIFGYAASIYNVVEEPIHSFVVGSSAGASTQEIEIDAIRGVWNAEFIRSRLFWLFMSAILVIASGFLFKARKAKASGKSKSSTLLGTLSETVEGFTGKLIPKGGVSSAPLWTNLTQLLRPGSLVFLLIIAALAGTVLPFQKIIAPAIWLLALFPLTRQSGVWENRPLREFSGTLPTDRRSQLIWQILAGILMLTLLFIPSAITLLMAGDHTSMIHMGAIIIGLPVITAALGRLTRSGVTARLFLLFAWYIYLNM